MPRLSRNDRIAEQCGEVLLNNRCNLPDAIQISATMLYQSVLQMLAFHDKDDDYLTNWVKDEINAILRACEHECQDPEQWMGV